MKIIVICGVNNGENGNRREEANGVMAYLVNNGVINNENDKHRNGNQWRGILLAYLGIVISVIA